MSKYLPIHPQPQIDELLSSWMFRLAFENRYNLHTFYSKVLSYKDSIWNRDIDCLAPHSLLSCLSDYTGQGVSRLKDLTMNRYSGLLYEGVRIKTGSRWITNLGIYHRLHKNNGLHFCPLCLRSDKKPYFRTHWRLGLYCICSKHNCLLMDKCPFCHSVIEFCRNGVGRKKQIPQREIYHCTHCGFDVSQASPDYIDDIDLKHINEYKKLIHYFEAAEWTLSNPAPASGLALFEGIWILISILNRSRSSHIRQHIQELTEIDLERVPIKHRVIEDNEIACRLNYFLVISWLMDNWDQRFDEIFYNEGLSLSLFSEYKDRMPYWLEGSVTCRLNRKRYIPNRTEYCEAKDYLRRNNKLVNISSIRRLLGCSIKSIEALRGNESCS